jgi:hypothetical protein
MAPEHDLPLEEYHRAGHEITNGNPEVYKRLYSRRDDVTLANPFGPPVRGWSQVSATLDRAAEKYRDGEVVGFENVSTGIGSDLAYTVEVESYQARWAERRRSSRLRFGSRPSFGARRTSGRWCTGTLTRSPRRVRRSP